VQVFIIRVGITTLFVRPPQCVRATGSRSCVSSSCQSVLPPPAYSTGGVYIGEPGSHAKQCQPTTMCTGAPNR
jgi:hypothetical protein